MAGIGFALHRLVRRDDLSGAVLGYGYATLITSGPWIATVVTLVAIGKFAGTTVDLETLVAFRSVIIYNFMFSIVTASGVMLASTRYLADAVYRGDCTAVPVALVSALALVLGCSMVIAVSLYTWGVDLPLNTRVAAIINFLIVSGIWVVVAFLSLLRRFVAITLAFMIGLAVALLSGGLVAERFGAGGMLWAFTVGLAFTFFALLSHVLCEFRVPLRSLHDYPGHLRRHWHLALSGFAYGAAIWVDKWVMWLSHEGEVLVSGMVQNPAYDSAMFVACLTMVPAIALFTIHVETEVQDKCHRFYGVITGHGTLAQIHRHCRDLTITIGEGARRLVVQQGVLAVLLVLTAPVIVELADLRYHQLGILRFGILGAFFHVLFLCASNMLLYFDMQRVHLWLQVCFLVTNALFTTATLALGFPYYGYGYFLAALVSAAVAGLMLVRILQNLPYLAFIGNNPSIR